MLFLRERQALKVRRIFYVISRSCFVLVCSTVNIILHRTNTSLELSILHRTNTSIFLGNQFVQPF